MRLSEKPTKDPTDELIPHRICIFAASVGWLCYTSINNTYQIEKDKDDIFFLLRTKETTFWGLISKLTSEYEIGSSPVTKNRHNIGQQTHAFIETLAYAVDENYTEEEAPVKLFDEHS